MKQTGLIDRIIGAMGLEDATSKLTPSEGALLVKNAEGENASGQFSYSSDTGMLLYLSGHSRPDIALVLNQIMNRQSNELVDTSRLQGLESWF